MKIGHSPDIADRRSCNVSNVLSVNMFSYPYDSSCYFAGFAFQIDPICLSPDSEADLTTAVIKRDDMLILSAYSGTEINSIVTGLRDSNGFHQEG